MLIVGDVHGCLETLKALLAKAEGHTPIFVGDLVDRGPKSAQVVQLVIDNGWQCVRGNHEQMMLDATAKTDQNKTFHHSYDSWRSWMHNGGIETLASYGVKEPRWEMELSEQFKQHREWMTKLPYYIEFDNEKNANGDTLFVSHAGLPYNNLEEAIRSQEIMWHRGTQFIPEGKFSIFGHTPQKDARPLVRKYYANVDTGACFKRPGYKTLTGIIWPTLEIIQQENIE